MKPQQTSAVEGMPVSEMRKCLAEVRDALANQSAANPFQLRHKLSNGMEIWHFVHSVATGLHNKRSTSRSFRVANEGVK